MKDDGWFATLMRGPGRRRPVRDRSARRPGPVFIPFRRSMLLVASLSLLALIVGAAMWLGPNVARGEETAGAPQPGPGVPTAAQTKELLESGQALPLTEQSETDLHAAQTMPHRDLEPGEALELAEAVFEPELEATGGIFDELEPAKYLSDYAAVVPVSSLPEQPGEPEGSLAAEHPNASVLVESSLPLRTENSAGEEAAVDLSLEHTEGELQPQNPLAEVGIPEELGEGISLPTPEIGVTVAGAPASLSPTDVEEAFAFYPEVAEDTDLIVEPTPQGAETMTDIRSAEAPTTTTYQLSLPTEASLEEGPHGGAEVVERGRATLVIPPATATDAAGDPVPVTMAVEGDDLKVAISPGPSTAYPVLVDPSYIVEYWCWAGCGRLLAGSGWTSSTNTYSYEPEPGAQWDPSHYPGLDLTSGWPGAANVGTHADWAHWVPRYSQDMAKYHEPPTTFISLWMAEGVLFLPFGNYANYPAMVIGLLQEGVGWAPGAWVHYGGEGELANWGNVLIDNPPPNSGLPQSSAVKGVDEDLITYESEAQAKYRDTFIGESTVQVVDLEAPRILELTPPTAWVTGASASIGYGFEDTGLGVWSSGIGLPGEVPLHHGWGTGFGCVGDSTSPCPRVVRSSEAGSRPMTFVPSELPTGEDNLEVVVGDPIWEGGHNASKIVPVKVDNKAPEVELSGALTEQEKLGTLKSEYPLSIKATDGTEADPQSGVARVEVRVDGKAKSTWTPGCATKNCSFSGAWTLKTSEYTAASHEVEVLVTDAAGVVSENTIEVDLGEAPPQTSFTSPHPSHETTELKTISFKATRGGAPVEGASFKCSLDGGAASACTNPYKLPEHFVDGPHTFTVAAIDKSGKADPTPATWRFETDPYPAAPQPNEKLVFPETGKQTASYYTLEAEWGGAPEGKAAEGVSGVTFQMELPEFKKNAKGEWIFVEGKRVPNTFETVPAECTIEGQGRHVSWPLAVHEHPGHSAPLYLKVRGCPVFEHAGYPEKGIQFRAVFDGGAKVAGASAPATTEFVLHANANRVASDATETVGPATVDLLTGAFTTSRTDVSIPVPGYEANLEFGRTYSSTVDTSLPGSSQVLGGVWQPTVPLESESEGQAWSRIVKQVIQEHGPVYNDECWTENEEGVEEGTYPCPAPRCNGIETCEEWLEEDAQPHEEWIELLDSEGSAVVFEIAGENNFVAPEYARELKLTYQEGNLVLAYPNGSRNIFIPGATNEWKPKYLTFQSSPSSMRMVYEEGFLRGEMKLVREIAPTPEAIKCEAFASEKVAGCRTLAFEYHEFSIPSHYGVDREKLVGISYYGPSGSDVPIKVAQYEYELKTLTEIPIYGGAWYVKEEMLVAESDPRLPDPAETYSYDEKADYGNLLHSATPPGQEPWSFEYEYGSLEEFSIKASASRLKAVTRAGAKTTLAYGVPVSGTGAPYEMGAESIAKWGQTDLPVDATAVFPPNHVPSKYPPTEYTGATIHYMDPEGYEVNTASPSPPGVTGATIATTETDVHGDVVRELSPRARLAALESANPPTRSHELDRHTVYNAAGTEALETWGPLHPIRIQETGEKVEGREHTTIRYDEEEPTPQAGTPPAYLPTKETTAVVVSGGTADVEPRVTETRYEWAHRLPKETIVDPSGLDIRTVTEYNPLGQVVETRQPKGVAGGTAGDTKTIYYSAEPGTECKGNARYADLPCEIIPAAQAEGTGRPRVLEKFYTGYNAYGEPETVIESPDLSHSANERETLTTYDAAGRPVFRRVHGGGVEVPPTETVYSTTTGMLKEEKFACSGSCTGFNSRATTTEYNTLGQVTKYVDADGAKTEATYDAFGRPSTVTDPRGTETMHYDEASGVLTSLEVSGVGTFTAAYDADGDLIHRGLPNGITANTTYNVADEPTKLTYTKTSSCGSTGCTWFEETLERSAEGRILADSGNLVKNLYRYDKAGRLAEAQETPVGEPEAGKCTAREYKYDADSNRLSKTTRPPGVGGACATTGTTQPYAYDEADRLIGPTYDPWGRITSLPAEFAGGKPGGKPLMTEYFANNMVAKQEQNGVSNTFQLDSTGRQRQREQVGGVAGVEVFHYDGPGDSPSWTSLGSTWSRNVTGIGGELAAVQESTGTTTSTTFRLTDLHGDVVAMASSSPTATGLLSTSRFSEFGEPEPGTASARFGWLGGKSRRTELQSGVVQMGARSYIPQLGRFLTPDPQRGGSANAYDYADQDPINNFDLGGESCHDIKGHHDCKSKAAKRELHRALVKIHHGEHGTEHRDHFHIYEGTDGDIHIMGHFNSREQEETARLSGQIEAIERGQAVLASLGHGLGETGPAIECSKAASEAYEESIDMRNLAASVPGGEDVGVAASAAYEAAACIGAWFPF